MRLLSLYFIHFYKVRFHLENTMSCSLPSVKWFFRSITDDVTKLPSSFRSLEALEDNVHLTVLGGFYGSLYGAFLVFILVTHTHLSHFVADVFVEVFERTTSDSSHQPPKKMLPWCHDISNQSILPR